MNRDSQHRPASLLVSGGIQRPEAEAMDSLSGTHYHRARLSRVDLAAGSEQTLLDYETPEGARPETTPGIRFTAMTLDKDRLYLCTGTEIFLYSHPGLELLRYATHPHFHDIHHVAPLNSALYVASTGLDMVLRLDPDTLEPMDSVNAGDTPTWERFDQGKDWRLVHSTQPHEAHPNFLFTMNGQAWVTRGFKNDVMRLDDPSETVRLSELRVHDGVAHQGLLYFTSVDGTIIVLDPETKKIVERVDLKALEQTDLPLGWCRGLAVRDNVAYVGYTTLRTTRWKDNVEVFLNRRTGQYSKVLPSRVCAYDLAQRTKLGEYVFGRDSIGAVFGVLVDEAGENGS